MDRGVNVRETLLPAVVTVKYILQVLARLDGCWKSRFVLFVAGSTAGKRRHAPHHVDSPIMCVDTAHAPA
jgi:hypothetical protein